MSAQSTEDAQSSVGTRLRRVLAFMGLSIREFATRTAIPYRTLQSYLADIRRPGADHLATIASTGIDIHWLLTGQLRAPLRLDYRGDDWAELAEKLGALPQDLVTELSDLAFDLADQFAKRRATPLTVRQAFRAFSVYYWMILRSALGIAPLIAAAKKGKPKATEVRAIVAGTITADMDAVVEDNLHRLV